MKRNAIILAAGTSSRFIPLSLEKPKGLLTVKGEILIERQIRQLKEAGIDEIIIVTGYKSEQFEYLKKLYGVELIYNEDYRIYNNTSSLMRVADRLENTFICSSDNYFPVNPFISISMRAYYSALYSEGRTDEYCILFDGDDIIRDVQIGGSDSWYMIGHVFFSTEFSKAFSKLLVREYPKDEVRRGYWEDLFIANINKLPPMIINRYKTDEIKEFDNLDELRLFDDSYIASSGSELMNEISMKLNCRESDLTDFKNLSKSEVDIRFKFLMNGQPYLYEGCDRKITKLQADNFNL